MAAAKIFNSSNFTNKSFSDYLLCCFKSSTSRDNSPEHDGNVSLHDKQAEKEEIKRDHTVSYGSASTDQHTAGHDDSGHVSDRSGYSKSSVNKSRSKTSSAATSTHKSKGSSYNKDEDNTSSDSDDDVVRRYNTIKQSSSQHSVQDSHAPSDGSRLLTRPQTTDGNVDIERSSTTSKKGATTSHDKTGFTRAETHPPPSVLTYENVAYEDEPVRLSPELHSPTPYEPQRLTPERPLSDQATTPNSRSSMEPDDHLPTTGEHGASDEHLFDVSDLHDREPAIISKCGTLEVSFSYNKVKGQMQVTVHSAKEIPTKERGGSNNNQVRLLLLPVKKQRFKTKIKSGTDPVFEESFIFKVSPDDVDQHGVRFRIYACERMRRERMVGENIIGFASINQDVPTTHLLTVEPRSNLSHGESKTDVSSNLSRSESGSSTQSMQHGGLPELLMALSYNGTTGRLTVEVIKGSNFRNLAMNRAPDTYVKLTLMSPSAQEIARSKTSVRRGQPNPLYKETFMFQVALFQLPDVTLMVSVYNKRNMKRKDMIGWFSMGYNSSGEEESAHWKEMRESKGEEVSRWHALLEG